MELDPVTNPSLLIPTNPPKGKNGRSTQSLLRRLEHLPSVNFQKLRLEKYIFLSIFTLANLAIVYMSIERQRFYWIFLSIVMLRPLVESLEITLIIYVFLTRWSRKITRKVPDTPENFIYLLPCYNESYEELTKSLISLSEQKKLDGHNKAVVIVCDGRLRTKGMPRTTAAYLTEDIIEHPSSTRIPKAYISWDGSPMDVEVVQGEFKGLQVLCIIKDENRGKRDGIVMVRSFIHTFNKGNTNIAFGIFSAALSMQLTGFFHKASIRSVEYVVGMDADTRFDEECVYNLIQTVRESDKIVGVTGYVLADPATSGFLSIPYLYQNAEYIMGQYRRRLRQDVTTKKVTCLPGCCQLIRVLDSTCGPEITQLFGYYPKETDGLFRTIQSMMSEDRDHVCLVLRENADVQTRQCLSARAYTTVPTSFWQYLAQRRRWTIGPVVSDVLLTLRRNTGWFERAAAVSAIFHTAFYLSLFIARAYCTHPYLLHSYFNANDTFLGRNKYPMISSILFYLEMYRVSWDLTLCLRVGSFVEAVKYLVGFVICFKIDPFVRCMVQLYSLFYLDDFRWGKPLQAKPKDE